MRQNNIVGKTKNNYSVTKNSNFSKLPDINQTNPSFFHTKNSKNNENRTLVSTNYDTGNLSKFNYNSNFKKQNTKITNQNHIEFNTNELSEIGENNDKFNINTNNQTSKFF